MIETQYPLSESAISAINPPSSMANDDENFFDAIIVGTGLTESILAAYVRARIAQLSHSLTFPPALCLKPSTKSPISIPTRTTAAMKPRSRKMSL